MGHRKAGLAQGDVADSWASLSPPKGINSIKSSSLSYPTAQLSRALAPLSGLPPIS